MTEMYEVSASYLTPDDLHLKVLDHGFVTLRNIAGPTRRPSARFDADSIDPARCARISFDAEAESRPRELDLKLNQYLLNHHHCYHGDMEVLTAAGWCAWKDLGETATFLVPDPATGTLRKETHPVKTFGYSGALFGFKNKRMSYLVTEGHTMYFKQKYSQEFEKIKIERMSHWGWFAPKQNYSFLASSGDKDPAFQLIGFYLGDGCAVSKNRISFHFRKDRKKQYLRNLLNFQGIQYTEEASGTYEDGTVFWVETPEFLREYVALDERAKDKYFNREQLENLTDPQIRGLWDGLINSDGHIPRERNRVEFSSGSPYLVKLFMALAAYFALDAHVTFYNEHTDVTHVSAYPAGRTTLESRKQYHFQIPYTGNVYCATTSTGLLLVRGSEREFGFVCGNSTPIEMIEIWLEMKLPIFVARQFVRHRTATLNEVSARYVTLPQEWYIPKAENVGVKAKSNKQGRTITGEVDENVMQYLASLDEHCREGYARYLIAIGNGIAPELSRCFLSLNHYTHWIWKQDLWNMLHFLGKRLAPGAQYEARVYAAAMQRLLVTTIPELMEAAEASGALSK